jgi:hypothetical protein
MLRHMKEVGSSARTTKLTGRSLLDRKRISFSSYTTLFTGVIGGALTSSQGTEFGMLLFEGGDSGASGAKGSSGFVRRKGVRRGFPALFNDSSNRFRVTAACRRRR